MDEFVTLRKEWENWLISAAGALSAMIFLLKNCCPSCREAIFGDSFLGKWGIFSLLVVTNNLRYIRLVRLHIDVKNLSMCL